MGVYNPVFSMKTEFDELREAVSSGNSSELEKLLQQRKYTGKIDFRDSRNGGQTLLHLAADPTRRHFEIIRILLDHGANPKLVDDEERVPLHLAMAEGSGCFCKSCSDKAEECTRLLVEAWPAGVNAADLTSRTPVHYAAESRFASCAVIMLQNGADITLRSHDETGENENLTTTLLRTIPEVFEEILDQSIECDSGNRVTGKMLRIDFGLFLGEPQVKGPNGMRRPVNIYSGRGIPRAEGAFLRQVASIKNKSRDKILTHPVTELFMHEKEKALKIAFLLPQLLRLILAILYTLFVFIYYLHNCPFPFDSSTELYNSPGNTSLKIPDPSTETEFTIPFTTYVFAIKSRSETADSLEEIRNCRPWRSVHIMGSFVFVFTLIQLFLLIWKLAFKPRHSLTSSKWWCWTVFAICGITTLSVPVCWNHGSHDIHVIFYPMGSIGTFLIWALLLVELGSIPSITVRIEMFNTVLKTVLLCSLSYGLLLLAFGFGLHIMFPKNELFASPILSFVKVLTLMIGDTDYDGIFEDQQKNMPLLYSIPAHLFYASFLLLVTIVFMNLLIGLAVSDIQKLKRTAIITKTKGFIELLHLVELHLYEHNWNHFRLARYLQEKLSVVKRNPQGDIEWSVQIPAFEGGNTEAPYWTTERKWFHILTCSKEYPRRHLVPNKLREKLLKKFKSLSVCQRQNPNGLHGVQSQEHQC